MSATVLASGSRVGSVTRCAGLALLVLLLAACQAMAPAPVEDRESRRAPVATEPAARTAAQRPAPPPIYTVQRGDTLYSIAFRYGLDWRDVAGWNRIFEPFVIRPGQDLRLIPPPTVAQAVSPAAPVDRQPPPPVSEPLAEPRPPRETVRAPEPAQAPPEQAPRPPVTAPAPVVSEGPTRAVAGVNWRWPTEGRIVRPFDPAAVRRGIGIGGQVGQPVLAAADGRVVYSGSALIGYGELIIIKHNDTMLSAYAHNRVRLVEEGATVRAGQQIAEMGVNTRDEVLLHFEIRRNGQPENPLNFLPRR
ncbi:MAG: peptidoglycan DD-metalloendopeptidase family protein [Wenzhouxiangella sp.]